MKKLNQKGFSLVEVLFLVVIVGLIGLAGWYVWHNRTVESSNSVSTTNKQQSIPTDKVKTDDFTSTAKGSKQLSYSIGDHKLYYTPANDWKVVSIGLYKSTNSYKAGLLEGVVSLTSPDYKTKKIDDPNGECSGIDETISGLLITINVSQDRADEPTPERIANILNGTIGSPSASDAKEVTMGGIKGASYYGGPGECFSLYSTKVAFHGYSVEVTTEGYNMSKSDLAKLYNEVVGTIKFD